MIYLAAYMIVAFMLSSIICMLTLMGTPRQHEDGITSFLVGFVLPALWPVTIPVIIAALILDRYHRRVSARAHSILRRVDHDLKRLTELPMDDLKYIHRAGKLKATSTKMAKEVDMELLNRLADKHLLE
jgi:hypothetical protein